MAKAELCKGLSYLVETSFQVRIFLCFTRTERKLAIHCNVTIHLLARTATMIKPIITVSAFYQ